MRRCDILQGEERRQLVSERSSFVHAGTRFKNRFEFFSSSMFFNLSTSNSPNLGSQREN
jgi:hypothetical protein